MLRVELEAHDGRTAWAEYDNFRCVTSSIMCSKNSDHIYLLRVEDEEQGYRLNVSGFSGTAGDSLKVHNQKKFTTKDVDNDTHSMNCATCCGYKSGWGVTK